MQISSALPLRSVRSSQSDSENKADKADAPAPKPSLRDSYASAVSTGAFATTGATAGYFGGTLAGSFVNSLGGSARYLTYGPLVGGALGASLGLRMSRSGQNDPITNAVRAASDLGSGSSLGLVGGDALGHGLAYLTNSGAYLAFSPAAGAITGGLIGLAINRADAQDPLSRFAKGAAATAVGTTSGWYLLGGVGALVSHLAHNASILSFAPVLGAISGGLIGAAAYVINSDGGHGQSPKPPRGDN